MIIRNFLSSFVIFFLLSGCIGIRSGKVADASVKISPSSAKKMRIYAKIIYSSSFPAGKKAAVEVVHKKLFSDAIQETNCCIITNDQSSSDVVLEGSFLNESSGLALIFAVITGYTLYTIPSWINAKSRITAIVTVGKTQKLYNISDSSLMVQWLPFVLAMPFRENPIKMEQKMNVNLYRNFVSQMRQDGIIQ